MSTPGYFGHINLARPVFYIQYLNTVIKILRCTCIKCSKLLLSKEKYKHLNVDFRNLDISCDELPSGDVCFVRQILQHMSNESILSFLKSVNKYKYLIVTEHWPLSKNFVPNINKPDGTDIRAYEESGVVLTAPPFNLKVIKDIDLCEVSYNPLEDLAGADKSATIRGAGRPDQAIGGLIKTKILQLKN